MKLLSIIALAASFLAPTVPLADAQQPTVLTVARPAGPEWFGLYVLGKKAGWTRTQITRELRGGAAVLVAREETYLQATLAERQVERRQRDEKVYEARPGGRLLSFVSEREGDGGNQRTSSPALRDSAAPRSRPRTGRRHASCHPPPRRSSRPTRHGSPPRGAGKSAARSSSRRSCARRR